MSRGFDNNGDYITWAEVSPSGTKLAAVTPQSAAMGSPQQPLAAWTHQPADPNDDHGTAQQSQPRPSRASGKQKAKSSYFVPDDEHDEEMAPPRSTQIPINLALRAQASKRSYEETENADPFTNSYKSVSSGQLRPSQKEVVDSSPIKARHHKTDGRLPSSPLGRVRSSQGHVNARRKRGLSFSPAEHNHRDKQDPAEEKADIPSANKPLTDGPADDDTSIGPQLNDLAGSVQKKERPRSFLSVTPSRDGQLYDSNGKKQLSSAVRGNSVFPAAPVKQAYGRSKGGAETRNRVKFPSLELQDGEDGSANGDALEKGASPFDNGNIPVSRGTSPPSKPKNKRGPKKQPVPKSQKTTSVSKTRKATSPPKGRKSVPSPGKPVPKSRRRAKPTLAGEVSTGKDQGYQERDEDAFIVDDESTLVPSHQFTEAYLCQPPDPPQGMQQKSAVAPGRDVLSISSHSSDASSEDFAGEDDGSEYEEKAPQLKGAQASQQQPRRTRNNFGPKKQAMSNSISQRHVAVTAPGKDANSLTEGQGEALVEGQPGCSPFTSKASSDSCTGGDISTSATKAPLAAVAEDRRRKSDQHLTKEGIHGKPVKTASETCSPMQETESGGATGAKSNANQVKDVGSSVNDSDERRNAAQLTAQTAGRVKAEHHRSLMGDEVLGGTPPSAVPHSADGPKHDARPQCIGAPGACPGGVSSDKPMSKNPSSDRLASTADEQPSARDSRHEQAKTQDHSSATSAPISKTPASQACGDQLRKVASDSATNALASSEKALVPQPPPRASESHREMHPSYSADVSVEGASTHLLDKSNSQRNQTYRKGQNLKAGRSLRFASERHAQQHVESDDTGAASAPYEVPRARDGQDSTSSSQLMDSRAVLKLPGRPPEEEREDRNQPFLEDTRASDLPTYANSQLKRQRRQQYAEEMHSSDLSQGRLGSQAPCSDMSVPFHAATRYAHTTVDDQRATKRVKLNAPESKDHRRAHMAINVDRLCLPQPGPSSNIFFAPVQSRGYAPPPAPAPVSAMYHSDEDCLVDLALVERLRGGRISAPYTTEHIGFQFPEVPKNVHDAAVQAGETSVAKDRDSLQQALFGSSHGSLGKPHQKLAAGLRWTATEQGPVHEEIVSDESLGGVMHQIVKGVLRELKAREDPVYEVVENYRVEGGRIIRSIAKAHEAERQQLLQQHEQSRLDSIDICKGARRRISALADELRGINVASI